MAGAVTLKVDLSALYSLLEVFNLFKKYNGIDNTITSLFKIPVARAKKYNLSFSYKIAINDNIRKKKVRGSGEDKVPIVYTVIGDNKKNKIPTKLILEPKPNFLR